MRRAIQSIVAIAVVMCARTVLAAPPNGEDWISLFNGRDLAGWKVPDGDGGHWKVVEGVIDYDAASEARGNKNLKTEEEFGDFELYLEWRFKKSSGIYTAPIVLPDGSEMVDAKGQPVRVRINNADSGIILRGSRHQINLWCWPVGSGELWSVRRNQNLPAELRAAAVPKAHADQPIGRWNEMHITVKGDRVTVVLNGKAVIDNAQIPDLPESGPIELQHHGGLNKTTGRYSPASSLVQFRNIRVRLLP
jgi:hypothetical protein